MTFMNNQDLKGGVTRRLQEEVQRVHQDHSLLINADSLESMACGHINNELFKILCMLLEKVTQPWRLKGERPKAAGLTGGLASFHTLDVQHLSYLKVLGFKKIYTGELISYFLQHWRIF